MNIKAFFTAILISFGLINPVPTFKYVEVKQNQPQITLGSFNPVQLQPFSLAGGGVAIGATTMTLTTFNDINGVALTMASFGSKGYMTIEPSNKTKEEQISFTGVSGTTLTGVKSVGFAFPYTETSGFSKSHAGGAVVVASNTSGFYSQFAILGNTSTISGVWTFGSSTMPQLDVYLAPTLAVQLASKGYVDATSFAGAPNGSTIQKGIYQEASTTNIGNGTAVGSTGADLIVPNSYFNTTSSATTTVPVTKSNGKLSLGFTDLTEDRTYTGNVGLSGTTTVNGAATFNATTTFNASTTVSFNGTATTTFSGPVIGAGFNHVQYFTAVGTSTWTRPTGVTKIHVITVGGGASGGNALTNNVGGGGGGGGYAEKTIDVTSTSTMVVTVGTASATSSFGNILVSSAGNVGGTGTTVGGGGGGGTGTGGDLNMTGANGGYGLILTGPVYQVGYGAVGLWGYQSYGAGGLGGANNGGAQSGTQGIVIVYY